MWIIKITKIQCFYPLRILNEHWCIYSCLQIPPRENWFQYVRRVYATAINFPCIISLTLIKNVENRFSDSEVFICVSFSIVSYKYKNAQVTFAEKPKLQINSLKNWKLPALPSSYEGSLDITFSLPV